MAARVVRTLDIPDLQVLIQFPEDEDECYWHHRIGLLRLGQTQRWVMLSPDHDMDVVDFGEESYKVLARNATFPAAQRPYVYAFDPIQEADLRRFKREARSYLMVMGDGEIDAATKVWVVRQSRPLLRQAGAGGHFE